MGYFAIGLLTGLSLIVAIGAQNAYVLRIGLSEPARTVVPVVVLCALSDAALIVAGVVGLGALTARFPAALTALQWLGVAWLIGYALVSLRRCLRGLRRTEQLTASSAPVGSLRKILLTTAAFTWLNPHVYLDTMVLIGSIANAHPDGRWLVAAGAALASILWFAALGGGARMLRPLLRRPFTWPVIDGTIAATMGLLAVRLAVH